LDFRLWLLPSKAKSSTKGPKSHMCFCPKAVFSIVQMLKAPPPLLPLDFGGKNYPPATGYETNRFLFCFCSHDTCSGGSSPLRHDTCGAAASHLTGGATLYHDDATPHLTGAARSIPALSPRGQPAPQAPSPELCHPHPMAAYGLLAWAFAPASVRLLAARGRSTAGAHATSAAAV
jgi:hypothetical protein